MGCNSLENNSSTFTNQKKFKSAFKDVMLMKNNIENNSNFSLNSFLISAKSIPNFLSLLSKSIEGRNPIEDLLKYELETNIEVYDDINNCHDILFKNDERNKFIIAGKDFIENMDIKDCNEVKLEKENTELKISFKGKSDKMIIDKNPDYTYKFTGYESHTEIETDKTYKENYNDININDSFLLQCLINCLLNIDLFKNIFLKEEKMIRENPNKFKISNTIIDMIIKDKGKENNIIKERKAFIDLNKIINSKNMRAESKYLICPLIKNLADEFNNPDSNPIKDLFISKDNIYSICQNSDCKNEIPNNDFYNFEFNLKEVMEFKLNNKESSSNNLNIKDCFDFKVFSEKNNNVVCKKCGNKIEGTDKDYKIKIFPKILIIILNRGNLVEANNEIKFNIEFDKEESYLDMSHLSLNHDKINYDLIGILSYKKEPENDDKFYNIVFYKDLKENKWIIHDQYKKKEIKDKCFEMPYMLFYIKK